MRVPPIVFTASLHLSPQERVLGGPSPFSPFKRGPGGVPSFIRSSVHPFTRSSVHPFTRSSVHPFIRSSVHPFTRPFSPFKRGSGGVPSFIRSSVHPFTRSPVHPFTRSPAPSPPFPLSLFFGLWSAVSFETNTIDTR